MVKPKEISPIFIVYYNLGIGGIQKKIVDIVNFLAKKKPELPIYILLREGKKDFDLAWQIKNPNAKILCYFDWLPIKIPFFFSVFVFWETLKLKPQTILSFADLPSFASLWVKISLFWRKINVVVNERTYTSWNTASEKFKRVRSLCIKLFYPSANRILCLTEAAKEDLIKSYSLPAEKITIVSNWTALAKEKPLPIPKKFDLLYIGRLIQSKGICFLLEAVLKMKKQKRNIKLLIMGNGEEKDGILKFIKKHGLGQNIILMKAQYDIKPYLCRSRVLVCPSEAKAEGFPTAVLEAMAMKVPVVCRRFAGIEDVIADGKNGLIADSMDEFIEKIIKLLEDQNLYHRIVKQAKEDVMENHSLDNIKEYLRVGGIVIARSKATKQSHYPMDQIASLRSQ